MRNVFQRVGLSKILSALCATAVLGGVATQAQAQQEEKVLNIYNWSDYIAPDTIANFEKETGIKVRYDNFDSNEILHAKLVAGKTGYDIVVPSSNWARLQIEGGLLAKLDKSKLPNLKNLDPDIQKQLAAVDPGNQHLVDWLWGFTTVGINVDKVKAALGAEPMPENVWELAFNPKYISKLKSCGVSFLDSASDILPAALHYLGKDPYSKSQADYAAVAALLKTVRPSVTLFSSSGYINDMVSGSICMAVGWSGDISIARQRAIDSKTGQKIEALIPKTGGLLFFDTMAIPADAPRPGNAHIFINYIMRPEVHASLTNTVFYANPNKESRKFVKPEVANNPSVFPSSEDMAKMVPPKAINSDIRRLQTRLYTSFKTGL
ncbi:MAG: spermidine/putrescine ABC transporter substrate-binding protein PotF [Betaproteobacteria bacterium HGW-Betaproteobacteria-3]|jgi:putrescine transport system substrate-binding protein|nr:MAG: spermidine/putrescine ABC transporter substrate-binding protein PotF [Betaproteobacteria bacterium HGW-Betaproteobacteria-3]